MQTAIFSTKSYDHQFLEAVHEDFGHDLHFFEPRLTPETAPLADALRKNVEDGGLQPSTDAHRTAQGSQLAYSKMHRP